MGMTDVWTDDVAICSEFPIYKVPKKINGMLDVATCAKANDALTSEEF